MSFTDDLKRSLGFEETESSNKQKNGKGEVSLIVDSIKDMFKPKENFNEPGPNSQQQYTPSPQPQYRPTPRPTQSPNPYSQSRPTPIYDDFDDYVITPEQSFYEIVLIRPKTIDDINYVVDQVIEEQNPVILDLSFLEKESAPNFKLAGDKINKMRTRYGVQALLIARTEEKNLIIITPKKVKVINKG